jgi:hypothetical protein
MKKNKRTRTYLIKPRVHGLAYYNCKKAGTPLTSVIEQVVTAISNGSSVILLSGYQNYETVYKGKFEITHDLT